MVVSSFKERSMIKKDLSDFITDSGSKKTSTMVLFNKGDPSTLFVGNLTYNTTEEDIRFFLLSKGGLAADILHMCFPKHWTISPGTNRQGLSPEFASVEGGVEGLQGDGAITFKDAATADRVLESCNGEQLNGRAVMVQHSRHFTKDAAAEELQRLREEERKEWEEEREKAKKVTTAAIVGEVAVNITMWAVKSTASLLLTASLSTLYATGLYDPYSEESEEEGRGDGERSVSASVSAPDRSVYTFARRISVNPQESSGNYLDSQREAWEQQRDSLESARRSRTEHVQSRAQHMSLGEAKRFIVDNRRENVDVASSLYARNEAKDPYYGGRNPKTAEEYDTIVGQQEAEEAFARDKDAPNVCVETAYYLQNVVACAVETPARMAWHGACCIISPVPLWIMYDVPSCLCESLLRCGRGEVRSCRDRFEDYSERFLTHGTGAKVSQSHAFNMFQYRHDTHRLMSNLGCVCCNEVLWGYSLPSAFFYEAEILLERPRNPTRSGGGDSCCSCDLETCTCDCEFSFDCISDCLLSCAFDEGLHAALVNKHFLHSYSSFSGPGACLASRCLGDVPCVVTYEEVMAEWEKEYYSAQIKRTREFYRRRKEEPERYVEATDDHGRRVWMINDKAPAAGCGRRLSHFLCCHQPPPLAIAIQTGNGNGDTLVGDAPPLAAAQVVVISDKDAMGRM
jgi:hypothetical protein